MTVVVHLTVPTGNFTLGRLLQIDPAMRFELERVVPTTKQIVPYFWAIGGDPSTFEDQFVEEPAIDSLETCDTATELNGRLRTLYEVEWNPVDENFIHNAIDAKAAILEGVGTYDQWQFQLRFTDQTDVTRFRNECTRAGVGFHVDRVYTLDEWHVQTRFQLTAKQQELLLTALEEGYFDVPRKTSLDELAQYFDVSRQALSERLRRAHATLITHGLTTGGDDR